VLCEIRRLWNSLSWANAGLFVARELICGPAPVYPAFPRFSRLPLAALTAVLASSCDVDDRRAPEWAYIAPVILQPNCATSSCHSRGEAAAGLDFSDPGRGYESLFELEVWVVDPAATAGERGCKVAHGTVVCPRPTRPMVIPFNPSQSRLVNMLRARGAARMPPDRPLPEVDIQLIERWILNGARFRPDPADTAASDAGAPK
jgi:hypothetical protein